MFNFYKQASKYALPEWNYKNFEWYAQDNWKPNDRLTLDYGVRFYYRDAAVGHDAAGLELPAGQVRSGERREALHAGVRRRRAVRGLRAARDGPDADRHRGADAGQYRRRSASSAGSRPTRIASTAASRPGSGINDQLQDGNAFRVSPRIGAVYDLTGKGETIVRGGFGIFYDRPQGNMVFDMISNAPGVLNSTLDWGRLQDLTAAGGDPNPTLSLNPTAFGFKPPRVDQWNVGIQHKLFEEVILDVAYVGSRSTDLLRQVQINALPFGATFQPQNQDPTRVPSAVPGSNALPNDFLRPYRGYGDIRMWDYSGYANYKALQTSVTRRFDNGFMFSGFWVWSKAQGINSTDFSAGVPNLSEAETRHLDYSLLDYDRTHNFMVNAIYQTPTRDEQQGARLSGERLAALGRLPVDERPAVTGRLLDSRHRRREPDRHRRQSERAHRPDVRPGKRATAAIRTSSSATRRASRRRSRAARATRRRGSSCATRRSTTSTCRSPRTSRLCNGSSSSSGSTCSTR